MSGSGISWATCKSAPRSRQTTTPALHYSVFYRPDALPTAQNRIKTANTTITWACFFAVETFECPMGYARCYASRQCSLDYFFCDGEDDCDVGTDEDPAICCTYEFCSIYAQHTHTYTYTNPFNAPFQGLPGWAGTRKVKPTWILLKQETVSGSGITWAMQVCTSLQTDNHASTPPLSFLQAGCPSCRPTNSVKALKTPIYAQNIA